MKEKMKWFMRLTITNTTTGKAAFAMYPADKFQMLESLDMCGIPYGGDNYTHLAVSYNGTEADSHQVALTGVIEHQTHPPSIHELNCLGEQIQSMSANGRGRMEQALNASPESTIADAISTAHGILGDGIRHTSKSMQVRPVLFGADEPYIQVRLVPEDDMYTNEEAGVWVNCPATDAELESVADQMGVDSYRDLEVCDVYGMVESIADDMCMENATTFDELNALALTMKSNDIHRQLAKYKAVLSLENCSDIGEAADLAGKLDSYEFYLGESLSGAGSHFRNQNPYGLNDGDLAEDMGFEETEYGTVRKADGIKQEHTGQTLC